MNKTESRGDRGGLRRLLVSVMLAWPLIALLSPGVSAQSPNMDKFVAMGTGSVSGVFYPVGKGICKFVNYKRIDHRVRCLAYETGGSVYNIEAVRSRELDIGITRSDLLALTYEGKTDSTADMGPADELRSIGNLYAMPIGIIVKKSANIKLLDNFVGKRMNFGNRGSGKRTMAELLFKYKRWSKTDFKELTELPTKEMGEAFCADKLDILLEILGHPAEFYHDMIHRCGGELFSFLETDITGLTEMLPYSEPQAIPGGMYPQTPDDIKTFGYQAILFSSGKVNPKTIYHVMQSAIGDLKKFQNIHAALASTDLKDMVKGLNVPLHAGAMEFFGKKGVPVE